MLPDIEVANGYKLYFQYMGKAVSSFKKKSFRQRASKSRSHQSFSCYQAELRAITDNAFLAHEMRQEKFFDTPLMVRTNMEAMFSVCGVIQYCCCCCT